MTMRRFFDGAQEEIGSLPIEKSVSDQNVALNSLASSASFFSAAISSTASITLDEIESSVSISLLIIQATSDETVELNSPFSSTTIFSFAVTSAADISLSTLDSGEDVFLPAVSASSTVALEQVSSTASIFSSELTSEAEISLSFAASASEVYVPTSSAASTATVDFLASTAAIPALEVESQSVIVTAPPASESFLFLASVSPGAVTVSLSRLDSAVSFGALSLVPTVELQKIDSTAFVQLPAVVETKIVEVYDLEKSTTFFLAEILGEKFGTTSSLKYRPSASMGGGLAFKGSARTRLRRAGAPSRAT